MAVVALLRRMLDSEERRAAPRSRDFLAHVVTESLPGRATVKERTVARNAWAGANRAIELSLPRSRGGRGSG
jgi:hypothetical protein